MPIPEQWLEERVLLGGTAERAIFARTHWAAAPEGFSLLDVISGQIDPNQLQYEPPRIEIVRVNLRTLESETLHDDVVANAYGLRTDGKWLAWLDWDQTDAVQVIDLDSGEGRTYSPGLQEGPIMNIAAIRDPYLVLEAGPASGTTSLVVIDLQSDEQLFISPAHLAVSFIGMTDQLGSISVHGDRMAMHVYKPVESIEDFQGSLNRTIELVDLTTGQRSTLVSDVSDLTNPVVLLEADRLLLLSSTYVSPAAVRSYALDGGEPATLLQLELGSSLASYSSVDAFNARGLVIRSTHGGPATFLGGASEQFDFHAFDGRVMRIFEHAFGPFPLEEALSGPSVVCWLVDEFVVYTPPDADGFVAFDVTTQTQRQFEPFEP